ncbi:hypothetical protein BZA05DRAFT_388894 [Tricharina praecox]|uniref:uncharacterized protein n=1 Tax=Tricharina praecox TaxID=43433 RepID=UPI00221F4068|nr:uncharacterized protein BZA05DRAFT_388894 [Tricharina praecox]KAI5856530.1 hypothetical protein BZA05DRAFT_388894 [Tricharina praecox]
MNGRLCIYISTWLQVCLSRYVDRPPSCDNRSVCTQDPTCAPPLNFPVPMASLKPSSPRYVSLKPDTICVAEAPQAAVRGAHQTPRLPRPGRVHGVPCTW